MQSNIIAIGAIIIFLALFELTKRSIFAMFSDEFIKEKFNIFRSNMISFIIGTLVMISGSFYLSLHGAQEFIDNSKVFQKQTETIVVNKTDSINKYYFDEYIKPLKDENSKLNSQNDNYLNQTSYKAKYANLISENNVKITKNNDLIANYEKRRDDDVKQYKDNEKTKLTQSIDENKTNIINFIIISTFIEFIIMLGVYHNKYYLHRIIREYEETVVSTPEFKRWHKYNFLLNILFNRAKEIDDQIPTVNELLEISESGGMKLTKQDLDKFIKVLYYLEIVKLSGKRRVVMVKEEDAKKLLKNYFNIH